MEVPYSFDRITGKLLTYKCNVINNIITPNAVQMRPSFTSVPVIHSPENTTTQLNFHCKRKSKYKIGFVTYFCVFCNRHHFDIVILPK